MTKQEAEEFEAIVGQFEEAAKDAQTTIATLKNEVETLKDELAAAQNQPSSGGELCHGCFRWRVAAAAVVGLGCGLFSVVHLQNEQPELGDRLALALTGHTKASQLLLVLFLILTTAAPVLIVVGEYKILRFKQGFPGVLRTAVEIWQALRAAYIRGMK